MNNVRRDFSIDFIKGLAILSVVFVHNLPGYYLGSIAWLSQGVPLFLIITGYLTYSSFEKGKTIKTYFKKKNVIKVFNRIFMPFLIVTSIQIVIYSIFGKFSLKNLIMGGGIGPGSYYPWLYLQFWVLLPFIIRVIDLISFKSAIIIFISISVLFELMTNILQVHPSLYRILFYRYLLVVVLGCLSKKEEFKITKSIILLGLLSLVFSLVFIYTTIDFEPFFTKMWKGFHWITAFYPLLLFLAFRLLYTKINNDFMKGYITKLGVYSYEIFLCQMFVFSMFSKSFLSFIDNKYIELILYVGITTAMSILPVLFYKEFLNNKKKREKIFVFFR